MYIKPLVIKIQQLKSKEQNYKSLYKNWKWLKEQLGFRQDPNTSAITASLQAWNNVIKVCSYLFCIYIYL